MTDTGHVIASMIAWLDEHQHDGMHPSIREALTAEDPRTWAEVHAAGVVTDADVIAAWLSSQAPSPSLAEVRRRAAEELAAEFGTTPEEWLI